MTHLGKENVLEVTSLLLELSGTRCVASNQVLEDAAVRSVGHTELETCREVAKEGGVKNEEVRSIHIHAAGRYIYQTFHSSAELLSWSSKLFALCDIRDVLEIHWRAKGPAKVLAAKFQIIAEISTCETRPRTQRGWRLRAKGPRLGGWAGWQANLTAIRCVSASLQARGRTARRSNMVKYHAIVPRHGGETNGSRDIFT